MALLFLSTLSEHESSEWYAELHAALPEETILHTLDPATAAAIEIAIVVNPPPGVLNQLPNLRFIQSLWAGVEKLLLDPTLPPHVPLARMVDPGMTADMVEYMLGWTMALHRQFARYQEQQRTHRWQPLPQPRAQARTVGVLGLGEMGGTVAQALARVGFHVCGWSRRTKEMEGIHSFSGAEGLPAMLAQSEILINLLPLTRETRGILNATLFAQLPQGAQLINAGRGAHLVDDDLLAALDRGQLDFAVLDVFPQEPLPIDHRFWAHPKIAITPHVAAHSERSEAALLAASNIRQFRNGQPINGEVNRVVGY